MKISDELEQLERKLLIEAVRRDGAEVASHLADGFREFGASGRVFDKAATISALREEQTATLRMPDFHAQSVVDGVVLVTYRCVREAAQAAPRHSLRSSLWVHREGRWQMLFHQGTPVPQEP